MARDELLSLRYELDENKIENGAENFIEFFYKSNDSLTKTIDDKINFNCNLSFIFSFILFYI